VPIFLRWLGAAARIVDSGVISPVDETSSANFTQDLGQGVYPLALFVESAGKYLYVQTNSGLLIYSIYQSSGALTELNDRWRRSGWAPLRPIRRGRTSIR
jgi:6-phosphogluconolactonase (cycloisomerase 2 family)